MKGRHRNFSRDDSACCTASHPAPPTMLGPGCAPAPPRYNLVTGTARRRRAPLPRRRPERYTPARMSRDEELRSTLLDQLNSALAGRYIAERRIGAGGMATV